MPVKRCTFRVFAHHRKVARILKNMIRRAAQSFFQKYYTSDDSWRGFYSNINPRFHRHLMIQGLICQYGGALGVRCSATMRCPLQCTLLVVLARNSITCTTVSSARSQLPTGRILFVGVLTAAELIGASSSSRGKKRDNRKLRAGFCWPTTMLGRPSLSSATKHLHRQTKQLCRKRQWGEAYQLRDSSQRIFLLVRCLAELC